MTKRQLNVRIPDLTQEQIDALRTQYKMTKGEVVTLAVDRLFQQEGKTMSEQAHERVNYTPELDKHTETIFYDWPNWDEHIEWIVTAPVDEIVDWAEAVEADAQE